MTETLPSTPQEKHQLDPTKRQFEFYLNRVLLALCFLTGFILILLLISVKIDTLISVIGFGVAVLVFLFPSIKRIHEKPWFRNLWTTVILLFVFFVFYTGVISLWLKPTSSHPGPFPNPVGFIPFGSNENPAKLDTSFLWEPGREKSSGYAIGPQPLYLTSGPNTNQFENESSAPIVAYPFEGDFDAQVKLILHPTKGVYAGFGLRSPLDRATWIRLARTWDDKNNGLELSQNDKGSHLGFDSIPYPSDMVYLKIVRRASTITFLYSSDELSWTSEKQQSFDLPEKVEIYFFILAPEHTTAQFEEFKVDRVP